MVSDTRLILARAMRNLMHKGHIFIGPKASVGPYRLATGDTTFAVISDETVFFDSAFDAAWEWMIIEGTETAARLLDKTSNEALAPVEA